MLSFNITDRRLNPSGKNLNNRQRFLERVKKKISSSVSKGLQKRRIEDSGDAEISISTDGIEEPTFVYDADHGVWDHLLPGNHDYNVGDTIPRPPEGGGRGSKGAPDGEGEDDFRFYISHDEYIDAILDDLSLPDMTKESERHTLSYEYHRAGYTPVGAACNLALEKTMIQGIARRIALKTPKILRISELLDELDALDDDDDDRRVIEDEIAELRERAVAIPFLDKTDLRYHNTVKHQVPITQAVMMCCMDVSGSMTEHMKDLAKRFYILLYVFLKRMYKNVDVVFIRHTHQAQEVDEDTFFHSPETGGTVVSTAYDEMGRIIKDRYPINEWNIYCAQASDGDNTTSDNDIAEKKLASMLPWLQYLTYIECGRDGSAMPPGFVRRKSDLWEVMERLNIAFAGKIAMRQITDRGQIIEVFRSFFKRMDA